MEHWSNLNLNQAYRLQAPANRFDLHLLEQQGFATAGLGAAAGLTSPLPAHATLSPAAAAARSFTGLPHVSYGAIPMAPLFDSMAQLTQGFAASQSPYRAAMQGVGAQPTVYAIDSSGHPVSSAGRFVASIVAATAGGHGDTQLKTVSLFNTDPHTMADPVASSGGTTVLPSSSASSQVGYGGRNSGHAAPANPYAGLPTNYTTGAAGSDRYANKTTVSAVAAGEPPPAHSGSRLPTTARTPSYPTKEFVQPPVTVQRLQPPAATSQSREMLPLRSVYIPVEQRPVEANPPTAHSNLQRPGDDLMQKLLLSYGPRGQVQAVSVARAVPVTSFTSSSPVQMAQTLATVGRSQNLSYVDQSRGQGNRVAVSAYQNYGIPSPIHYASAGYVQPAEDVMEELSYDDVSSPEGMSLQDGNLAGGYLHNSGIVNKEDARQVIQTCSTQGAQRLNSIVLGRNVAIPDPTIQAQADSTTRPKKSGSTGRAVRATPGETGADRGGKRSRSGSSRSRAKGKLEEDVGPAGVQHRSSEMSVPDLSAYGGSAAYAQLLPAEFGSQVGQGYVTADAFGQYRISSDPYAAECMIAAGSRTDMSHHRMGTMSTSIDSLVRSDSASVQQQDTQVFMTNMFGNTFVNPNELLSVEQITFVDPNDTASVTYAATQIAAIPKQDPKHRPIIEEEFGHLASDPLPSTALTTSSVAPDTHQQPLAGTSASSSGVDQQKSVPESKAQKPAQSSAFLDSFMNFIQGKKPETLASVSTSAITKKPVLPKYIPEPPRPKPPPTPTSATSSPANVNSKPGLATNSISDPIVVQFSDDEDEEPLSKRSVRDYNIANAVNKALLSLNKADTVTASKTPGHSSTPGASKPRSRSTKLFAGDSVTVKTTSPSKAKSKSGTKKPRQMKRGSKSEKWVNGDIMSDDEGEVMVLDSPVVSPRERSTRKAKEVAVQRGLGTRGPKGKRGTSVMVNSGSEESLDDVEPDSDDDAKSTHARGYDSDKDPAWNPHQSTQVPVKKISVVLSSGSEDESSNKMRGGGRGRLRGRGRGRSNVKAQIVKGQSSVVASTSTASTSEIPQNDMEKLIADTSIPSSASSKCDSEKEAVKESFSVYVQTLVSQALEPTFMTALLAQPDDYYIDPLKKIDSLLMAKKTALTSLHEWTSNFLTSLTKCSSFSIAANVESYLFSEATDNRVDLATKRVRFGSFAYDAEVLRDIAEHDNSSVREFLITDREAEIIPTLHGLHHFKFSLLQDCQLKVNKLKETETGVADDVILDMCLCDQPWMSQMLDRLSNLLG